MRHNKSLLLPLVFFAVTTPSPAQQDAANFAPVINYDSGGLAAYSVAAGDLNSDGKPDLVVANLCTSNNACTGSGSVSVLLGNGDGTFQQATAYSSGGYEPVSVAIADVNGDGIPDLVVANLCASFDSCTAGGSVSVLLGNGDGTFQTPMLYGSGGYAPASVAVSDVNGDGITDVLVTNQCVSGSDCHGAVSVLLGNGNGTFQPAVIYGSDGFNAVSVAVGDVNGDGKSDLVVANVGCISNCNTGTVGILLGNGDGTFQQAAVYGSGGYKAVSVAIADVNRDGILDLVTSNLCVSPVDCSSGSVGVLLGVGDGTFQPAVSYSSGGSSQSSATLGSVAVADVNGDGTPDVVVINQCGSGIDCRGSVGVLLGNGDATFQPAAIFGSGGLFATSMVIADVNGDSKPDIMVANTCVISGSVCPATSNGSVGVLINISTPFTAFVQPPIDVDGSSVFNAGRGVIPVKFTLSRNNVPTCTLPPATIGVTRTVGATLGLIEGSTYLMNADTGSSFRIDPGACQYIYNLAASQLGAGNYQVDINIGGIVVGNAVFALQ